MEAIVGFCARSYNALLPICEANRRLAVLGEEKTVGKLLSVIQRFELQNELGIRLLHKHNDISDAEIMFEAADSDDEGFALITSATHRSQLHTASPNSWQLVGAEYVPVEFSDPLLIDHADFNIIKYTDVLRELAIVLHETETQTLLGPCLHYGAYVESHAPSLRAAFLEKTDFESRANVVRYVELCDPAFTNSAKTKWRAVQETDADGNLVWTTACNCFCSVFPQGGHQGTKTHRYNPR